MAFHFGRTIVRDGLIMYLDAANRSSYLGTGINWNDLTINGNNSTLINGPTFSSSNGGSIVFDGVNDYVTRNVIDTGQNFTASAWIKPTTLGRGAIIANSYDYNGTNGWLLATAAFFNTDGNFYISIGADFCIVSSTGGNIIANDWNYITATITNGNTIKLYKNGLETSYSTIINPPSTITYTINQFNIGWRPDGLDPFSGNISSVKVYNRALSAQEILQNYNALKGRYGL